VGDALGDVLGDPLGSIGALAAWARDLVAGLLVAARDALADWWRWATDHPETVTVVLFWAFVGIAGVAILRRRARASRPRRRRRDA
jgi:hypothetical protein